MSPSSKNTSRKFTFDTEFTGDENRQAPTARARQKQTLTTEELEVLKTLARLEGENSASARLAAAVESLSVQVRVTLGESHALVEAMRAEAAQIALRQAMHQAIGEPRLTLRAAPAVVEVLEVRLADIAHEEGYEGRVMIAADPAMQGADCRIEWRGGGAERCEQTIEDALTALIVRRFSNNDVKG